MFKRDTKQWVRSTDGTKTSCIIMKGNPFKNPDTIIGVGMLVFGLVLTMRGSWISGGTDYDQAETRSLVDIGCLNATEKRY